MSRNRFETNGFDFLASLSSLSLSVRVHVFYLSQNNSGQVYDACREQCEVKGKKRKVEVNSVTEEGVMFNRTCVCTERLKKK